MISSKGLSLIQRQHRIARKAMPTGMNPFPRPLNNCDNTCFISIELGIPCCHKIYERLCSGTSFTKNDIHPHWRLRESSLKDPYRYILDPKIATALRGRLKNTTQTIPSNLAVDSSSQSGHTDTLAPTSTSQPTGHKRSGPKGSRNKSTLAKIKQLATQQSTQEVISIPTLQSSTSTQRLTRSQSAVLSTGRSTGARAAGQRLQPNIRRTRSQWELISSDEET